MPLAPPFRNTWQRSCANWMAARNRQLLFLATPYLPLEIRNRFRKFIAPRQRNPALEHCNLSWFQSRGAGRQIASVCETEFARGRGRCVRVILSDLLLFSCLAAFYTGIVLAIASLLN